MPKRKAKQPPTPPSMLRSWIRNKIWLPSRERSATLRRDNYTCQRCGKKQYTKQGKKYNKVEVHHIFGTRIDLIIKCLYRHLLPDISKLETLCKDCHKKEADDE